MTCSKRTIATLALIAFAGAGAGCQNPPSAVIACPAGDSPAAKPGQMTMTGTATLEVSPDCADLTMTLAVDDPRPADATAHVDAKQRALVAALAKIGVGGADLKLSNLSLTPIYEPNPTGYAQIKVHAYRAEITLTATTRDFAKISALMEAGADAGATQMSSQFRNDDLPKLKAQVRDMALIAVQAKAKQTAHALDTKVGRVLLVAENAGGQMWNQAYFPQANVQEARVSDGALGGTLQPLTLDITVTYELVNPS